MVQYETLVLDLLEKMAGMLDPSHADKDVCIFFTDYTPMLNSNIIMYLKKILDLSEYSGLEEQKIEE